MAFSRVIGAALLALTASGCRQLLGLDPPNHGVPTDGALAGDIASGYTPGLASYGDDGTALWQSSMSDVQLTWTPIAGVTPTGVSSWDGAGFGPLATLTPLGITHTSDIYSVWLDGEIYLTAGQQLKLQSDDVGFVELAPALMTFQQAVVSRWPSATTVTPTVAANGWVPIHIGWSNTGGGGSLTLQHAAAGGGGGGFAPFTIDELRTPRTTD